MRKILTALFLFFYFFSTVFSYEVEVSTNKEKVFLGENFKLNLKIKDAENLDNLGIVKMNFLDDFEIIGQSNSSSFSSQMKSINGKVEQIQEMQTTYSFILSPKKVGNFELGPIILDDGKEQKETNSVKIQVLENEIANISPKDENEDNFYAEKEKISEKSEGQKDGKDKNIFLIIGFLITIFITIFVAIFAYYKRKKDSEKSLDSETSSEGQNFEKEVLELPPTMDYLLELEDKKFIFEFEKILKIKLERKNELTLEEENILGELSLALNKLKYSELKVDKKQTLELLNKF